MVNRSKSKNSKTKGLAIKNNSTKPSAETSPKTFPIVGIGASAGGLEAFISFLEALPTDTGMGFVFVQHLDPVHKSLGPEIFSRSTRMEVRQAKEGMRVDPNCVYLIPPNHDMVLAQGVLTLLPRTETRGQHLVIDSFFQSLATDRRGGAIGVVLSGAASDGTQGLRAIKAEGGLALAQDPKTAKHGDMPKSAIAAGFVDLILPPADIARELARISKHPHIAAACEANSEAQTESDQHIQDNQEDETPRDAALRGIFAILRVYSRIDFSNYKHTTIKRRIERRMMVRRTATLEAYAKYLRENKDEVKFLFNDILINLTEFFRDAESYKALTEQIFPQLIAKRKSGSPIRIWVAACSTGEEAYSLAISLVEFLEESGTQFPIQIFATDISELCLQKARAGIYSESNLRGVSKERLRRFFDKVDGGYKINKVIRQLCLFSRHDLNADPAFGKLSLISCRNLLIYFNAILQKRVFPVFHYALNSGGFLWLGKSESTGSSDKLFTLTDKTHKFYTKTNVQTPTTFRFPVSAHVPEAPESSPSTAPVRDKPTSDFDKLADRIAVAKYAPPSVVVNFDFEILHIRGETGPYLQIASGPPSNNLFKMIRPDLLHTLRMTIHEARAENRETRRECPPFDLDGNRRTVGIHVVPTNSHEPQNQRTFLIFFEELASGSSPKIKKPAKRGSKVEEKKSGRSLLRIIQLEQESSSNKLLQQTMFEDFEANREELTAGNEELQSTNEELQSTNEELETAKEEVQSSNEELTTVNDELQNRNAELTGLTSYLNNILVSANIPLVIVDGDHRIRRFTPQAARIFSFIDGDVGRPLGDIKAASDLDLDGLVSKAIETLITQESEIRDNKGRWMRLQIRPFKTIDGRIDGAVIALLDIDALKSAILTIQSQSDRFHRIAAVSGIGLSYGDYPLFDLNWDEKTREHFQVPANAHITMDTFFERLHPEDRERTRMVTEEAAKSRSLCDVEFRTISPSDESAVKWIRAFCWTDFSPSGTPVRTDGVTLDITEQKRIFQRLEDEKLKLEAIFEASPASMALLRGPTFIYEKVNSHFREQLVGGRDVIGKTVFDATPEADIHIFIDLLKGVLETGIPYSAKEVVTPIIRTPGGKPQDTYLDFTYTRVNDSQGKPYGIYAYTVDVTEKVMARKQIEQLAKKRK